jgi:hypothetical protein
MWFSLCLRHWLRWLCGTSKPFMVCCFAPAQKLYSKWLVIPGISAPRSASSACCTPGTKNSNFLPMSTASSPLVGSRSIAHAGFGLALHSFSPSMYSDAYFAGSSWLSSSRLFSEGSCTFPAIWLHSLNLRSSPLGSGRCFAKIGSSIPNHRLVVLSMCSTISAVTLTAWPSLTTDCFRSRTDRSPCALQPWTRYQRKPKPQHPQLRT